MKTSIQLNAYIRMIVISCGLLLAAGCASTDSESVKNTNVNVTMKTAMGDIEIELYQDKAPLTVTNFLRYVDAGEYNGGTFYRVVRADNDNGNPQITVIQGNIKEGGKQWPEIKLETTKQTGITHLDGTLSMARGGPDTATSYFFICVGPQPALDFGGKRNNDGLGFAAFGRVVKGMDIVRKINAITETKVTEDAYMKGQMLEQPVVIRKFERL